MMAGEHAGPSIIERLWEQSVAQYGKLMDLHDATGGVTQASLCAGFMDGMSGSEAPEAAQEAIDYLQTQGKLQGICYALAVMLNPYEVDLDAVKAQVVEQYNASLDEEEDEEEG